MSPSSPTPPPTPSSEPPPFTIQLVSFGDGCKRSDVGEGMALLTAGGPPLLYDHTHSNTPFQNWIAMRRHRMKRKFKYDRYARDRDNGWKIVYDDAGRPVTLPEGQYYIWVEP